MTKLPLAGLQSPLFWLGLSLLAAPGPASMAAPRLVISDGQSEEFGRLMSVLASVVVIATGAVLLSGAAARQMGWA